MVANSRSSRIARRYLTLLVCASSLLIMCATSTLAQGGKRPTPFGAAPGSPTGSYRLSDIDSVNLFNGRVNIQIPLVNVPSRGAVGGPTTLVVNSPARWQVTTVVQGSFVSVQPAEDQYGQGVLSGQYSIRAIGGGQGGPNPCNLSDPSIWVNTYTRLSVIAPDGTEHEMRDLARDGQWYSNASTCYGPGPSRGKVFVTTDGSGMTFVSDDVVRDGVHEGFEYPTGMERGWLLLGDGRRYRIDGTISGGGGNNWANLFERDRNGNMAGPDGDSLYRKPIGNTTAIPSSQCLALGPGAGPQCYYIGYKGWQGVERRTWISYDNDFPYHFPNLVVLPNGLAYRFYYNQYGDVIRLDLPTGGSIEYDYEAGVGGTQPTFPPGYTNNVVPGFYGSYVYRRAVARRVYRQGHVLESYQTFSKPEHSDGQQVTNAGYVDAKQYDSNNQLLGSERHFFYGAATDSFTFALSDMNAYQPWRLGREYHTEVYDENGVLLRQKDVTWAQRAPVSWWTGNPDDAPSNDPRVTDTTTRLENGQTSHVTYVYDPQTPYNSLTDVYEYGFDGQMLRHVKTSFLKYQNGVDYTGANLYTDANPRADSTPYLRNLPAQVSVFDDYGERSRTTFEYDNYTPDTGNKHAALLNYTDISGLCTWVNSSSQCLNTNPADGSNPSEFKTRGNVTAVSRWLLANDGTPSALPLTAYTQYDVAGNPVKAIDESGNVTQVFYDDKFGTPDNEARSHTQPSEWLTTGKGYAYPTRTVNVLGFTAYAQFDYYTGNVVNTEDANGTVTSISYADPLGRQTEVVTAVNIASLRHRSAFEYNDAQRVVKSFADRNADNDRTFRTESVYDGLGRTTQSRLYDDANSPGQYVLTTTGYDSLGRVNQVSNPYRPSLNESPVYTTSVYDALGRVKEVTAPGSLPVVTEYDGDTVTVTDQAGNKRSSTSDSLGRMTRVVEDPDGYGYVTDYAYDALGNLRKVKQSSPQGFQERFFAYDSLGRLVRTSNPEVEINSNLPAHADPVTNRTQWSAAQAYDVINRTSTMTDPRGVETTLTYDQLGRLKSAAYTNDPANTPTVTYTYDDATVPNSKGRLTSVSSSVSTYKYTAYDELGRITGSSQTTAGQTAYAMSYAYDLAGELISETYPSGRVVTTSYDAAGRVAGVDGQKGGVTTHYMSAIKYWSSGAVKEAQLGNGLVEHNLLNDRLQPKEIALGTSNTDSSVLKLEYAYGVLDGAGVLDATQNNGNVQSQKITVPGIAPLTQTYTYDKLDRLLVAQENGGASWKQTFTYDQYGNRSVDANNTTADAVGDDPQVSAATNRVTPRQGELYRYDKAGNLDRDKSGLTFKYDANGRVVAFNGGAAPGSNGTDYFFDGIGQRVKKADYYFTTVFVYDAFGKMVAEYSNDTPGGDGTSYLTADTLGTARVVTGTNGTSATVKARHDYLPFGEEIGGPKVGLKGGRGAGQMYAADDVRQKFTGKERDEESGLDYFLARDYASSQGRFTSVDPLMASARPGAPQSWNRYTYVINNPLKLVDPTGMSYFVGGSGAADPFIAEYRFDGFDQSPDGTMSNLTTEDMAGYYAQTDDTLPLNTTYGTVDDDGNVIAYSLQDSQAEGAPSEGRRVPNSFTSAYNCMGWGMGYTDRKIYPTPPEFGTGITFEYPDDTPAGQRGQQSITTANPIAPTQIPGLLGAKWIRTNQSCPAGMNKLKVYEDSANPLGWHVMRKDYGASTWSSKNGDFSRYEGIRNPDTYYRKLFKPTGEVNIVAWCVPQRK